MPAGLAAPLVAFILSFIALLMLLAIVSIALGTDAEAMSYHLPVDGVEYVPHHQARDWLAASRDSLLPLNWDAMPKRVTPTDLAVAYLPRHLEPLRIERAWPAGYIDWAGTDWRVDTGELEAFREEATRQIAAYSHH